MNRTHVAVAFFLLAVATAGLHLCFRQDAPKPCCDRTQEAVERLKRHLKRPDTLHVTRTNLPPSDKRMSIVEVFFTAQDESGTTKDCLFIVRWIDGKVYDILPEPDEDCGVFKS